MTGSDQALLREIPAMLLLWFGMGISLGAGASKFVQGSIMLWFGVGLMMIASLSVWWNLGIELNDA